jgi:hypothetical protein
MRPRKVIRRNVDGVSVTIELGHGDGEQTIHVLKGLIGELDYDRAFIEREAIGECPLSGQILELSVKPQTSVARHGKTSTVRALSLRSNSARRDDQVDA